MKLLLSLFLSLHGYADMRAGTDTGHGAASVVCREHEVHSDILSAELFDLWEGIHARGLRILRSNESVELQIERALDKLAQGNPSFAMQVRTALKQAQRDDYMADEDLVDLADLDPVRVPQSCQIEQLAEYKWRSRRLKINRMLYDTMKPTDQAATFVHEAIYKVLGDAYSLWEYGDQRFVEPVWLGSTSRATRVIVATLFSTMGLDPVETPSPADPVCTGDYFEFHVTGEGVHLTRAGAPMLSRTFAKVTTGEDGVAEGPLLSKLSWLEGEPKLSIKKTEGEYLVRLTGGRLTLPWERVECTADISSLFTQPTSKQEN